METKHIILNKNDKELLEEIKLKYGKIVSIDEIKKTFKKKYKGQKILERISFLSKAGWLFRIKRGLYVVITDIRSLSNMDISEFVIVQELNKTSYISFENALQHHGLFDQMLKTITAVTSNRARRYSLKSIDINFVKFKKALYFGFQEEEYEGKSVNIAEIEKAMLDMLYIRNDDYTISLILDIIRNNIDNIDIKRLIKYAKKFNLTVIRKVGFFLDQNNIFSNDLYNIVKDKKSYSKLTSNAKDFNSKWRLYIDNSLIG